MYQLILKNISLAGFKSFFWATNSQHIETKKAFFLSVPWNLFDFESVRQPYDISGFEKAQIDALDQREPSIFT